jgi:Putative Actinobacterial Holin-X, holin superfamily III
MADQQTQSLSDVAQGIINDVERLVGQRLGRLGDQLKDELGKAATAGASFGGGAGMMALGTMLGGLAVVHILHKSTGLPLWLCYAACSATACATGAGLFAAGAKAASEMDVIPDGARRAVREAFAGARE